MASGYSVVFTDGECKIKSMNADTIVACAKMTARRLFPLETKDFGSAHAVLGPNEETKLWHRRYGHLSIGRMQQLMDKHLVEGMPHITSIKPCEACSSGKQTKPVFPKGQARRVETILELIHADLMGPMHTPSLGGNKYVFLLTDDFSRYSWVYFLSNKGDALERFKTFKRLAEKQFNHPLKTLRTDRGGEFISKDFWNYCNLNGIQRQLSAPYSPQQNGVAERKNRTVMEMARSMLKEMHVPTSLWAEAIATAVYILNRSPSSAVELQTPYEALKGEKPLVQHLRVFGCVTHVLIEPKFRTKLDFKTQRYVFIGYCEETKGYKLFDPETKQVKVSRNVTFFEDMAWEWSEAHKATPDFVTIDSHIGGSISKHDETHTTKQPYITTRKQ